MTDKDDVRYMPRLHCYVHRVEYDFDAMVGKLWMPEGSNCDMHGCTTMFDAIDPYAERIETYAGIFPDTVYVKNGKKWEACL